MKFVQGLSHLNMLSFSKLQITFFVNFIIKMFKFIRFRSPLLTNSLLIEFLGLLRWFTSSLFIYFLINSNFLLGYFKLQVI